MTATTISMDPNDHPTKATSSSSVDVASAFVLPGDGVDLRDVERTLIRQALVRCHGNQTKAARLLRISRYALRSRMKKFALLSWPPHPPDTE